ncbi:MAG: hypothetical protein RJB66_1538 [Pseudomonadota bacterium]|jgi:regulator of replication initiation timing
MLKLWSFIIFCVSLLGQPWADAVTHAVTYQGRIIKPDGLPLVSESVNFALRIIVPNKNCSVYIETQNSVPMTNIDGSFLLQLGKGTRVGSSPVDFADIFSPSLSIPAGTTECLNGYTKIPGDSFQLQVSFDDGSGGQTLAGIDITAVPLAFESLNVGGTPSTSVLRVNGSSTPPLTHSKYQELLALLDGTSNQYQKTSGAPFATSALQLNGSTSGQIILKAPSAAGNVTWTLPGSDGLSGQVLQTNGSGILTWATPVSGASGTLSGISSAGAPIVIGGTASQPSVGITQANTTTSGYLASADWNSFNNKMDVSTFNSAVSGATCSAAQAMYWNSITSAFACASIAIPSTQVSGLVTSATTDTTNATNITSGTLSTARLPANVGIGTTSPQGGLHVVTNASTNLSALQTGVHVGVTTIASQDYAYLSLVGHAPTGGSFIDFHDAQNDGDADFRLRTNGPTLQLFTSNNSGTLGASPMMTFLGNGNIGIGNTNPSNKLEVAGNVNATGFTINGVPVATSTSTYWSQSGSNVYYTSGNVAVGTTSPTAKFQVESTAAGNVGGDATNSIYPARITDSPAGGAGNFNILDLRFDQTLGAAANSFGNLSFSAKETGGAFYNIAMVGAPITSGSGNALAGGLAFSTKNVNGNITEKMRIDSSGNVGIGTTSPTNKLQVTGNIVQYGGSANSFTGVVARNGTGDSDFTIDGRLIVDGVNTTKKVLIGSNSNHPVWMIVNGNSAMSLDTNGNVGIGTTAPVSALDIAKSSLTYSANTYNNLHITNKNDDVRFSFTKKDNATESGYIEFGGYSANTDPYSGIYMYTRATNDGVNASLSTRFAISEVTGNIGVGTNSPSALFHVMNPNISADTQFARFSSAGGSTGGVGYVTVGDGSTGGHSGYIGWDYGANGLVLNSHTAGGSVGGLFIKRVDNGFSRVGIGTTSPNYRLDVAGDINTSSCFRIGATTVSGTCTSDARLKNNIADYQGGLDSLLGVRVRTYQFNGLGEMPKTGETAVGVIAQELETTNPELVKSKMVRMHTNDETLTEIKVVDYSKFSYMLINAVKQLYAKILALGNQQETIKHELASKVDQSEINKLRIENRELRHKLETTELKIEDSLRQNQQLKEYLCSKDPKAPLCN